MIITTKKEANIEKLGRIIYADAPFDYALTAITTEGGRIMTLSELAYSRIQKGTEHSVSKIGSQVKEGIIFIPNNTPQIILLRNSIILENAKAATLAHKMQSEYLLGEKFNINEYLEKIPKKDYYILKKSEIMQTNRFEEYESMVWSYGKNTKDYGLFLRDAGVIQTGIFTSSITSINNQNQPYANQIYLNGLGTDLSIVCKFKELNEDRRVRGIIPIHHTSKKTSLEYTLPEMKEYVTQLFIKDKIPEQTIEKLLSTLSTDDLEEIIIRNKK